MRYVGFEEGLVCFVFACVDLFWLVLSGVGLSWLMFSCLVGCNCGGVYLWWGVTVMGCNCGGVQLLWGVTVVGCNSGGL